MDVLIPFNVVRKEKKTTDHEMDDEMGKGVEIGCIYLFSLIHLLEI